MYELTKSRYELTMVRVDQKPFDGTFSLKRYCLYDLEDKQELAYTACWLVLN